MNKKLTEKMQFAMDLTAMLTVEQLSKETKQPQEKVLLDFMESNTAEMLYNDSTKLWWDGPMATAEEYRRNH